MNTTTATHTCITNTAAAVCYYDATANILRINTAATANLYINTNATTGIDKEAATTTNATTENLPRPHTLEYATIANNKAAATSMNNEASTDNTNNEAAATTTEATTIVAAIIATMNDITASSTNDAVVMKNASAACIKTNVTATAIDKEAAAWTISHFRLNSMWRHLIRLLLQHLMRLLLLLMHCLPWMQLKIITVYFDDTHNMIPMEILATNNNANGIPHDNHIDVPCDNNNDENLLTAIEYLTNFDFTCNCADFVEEVYFAVEEAYFALEEAYCVQYHGVASIHDDTAVLFSVDLSDNDNPVDNKDTLKLHTLCLDVFHSNDTLIAYPVFHLFSLFLRNLPPVITVAHTGVLLCYLFNIRIVVYIRF